ncbi:KAP family NTPase [Vibrio sp. Of14-4]|uniref:KAP family P-loop NTPase fold protein n=1 Tax=Vibrio sp. Of14-4 TaxID=2724878 RepID=UPI001EF231DA|nr:P-loop NTPase fold protein [Vibrio sp. Of14-4]MCG7490912.1 KAP family NTPase [Vibrio sp. Of14-4]
MRLSLPEIQILPNQGFTQHDIFHRKNYGSQLTNFILNANENLVFALDSNWGAGKSTFIKMWHSYNNTHSPRLKTIYFDAFENDYQHDPFLALASEVYDIFEEEDEVNKQKFKDKASNVCKAFGRGLIKTGVKVATAGAIDGSTFDVAERELSTLVSDQMDSIIADKFESSKVDKKALKEFRTYLKKIVEEQTDNNNLVFIIDELDRCRPDFALEILEKIKHLFSVPGLTFILVMNREQLQESVKSRYGNGINASLYLQKFINVWLSLPKSESTNNHDSVTFLNHAIEKLGSNLLHHNQTTIRMFSTLICRNSISFREIERMLTYIAVMENTQTSGSTWEANEQLVIACVCYLKVSDSMLLKRILNKSVSPTDVANSIKVSPTDHDRASQALANVIAGCLCSEDELEAMLANKEVQPDSWGNFNQDMFSNICTTLDSFAVS